MILPRLFQLVQQIYDGSSDRWAMLHWKLGALETLSYTTATVNSKDVALLINSLIQLLLLMLPMGQEDWFQTISCPA